MAHWLSVITVAIVVMLAAIVPISSCIKRDGEMEGWIERERQTDRHTDKCTKRESVQAEDFPLWHCCLFLQILVRVPVR